MIESERATVNSLVRSVYLGVLEDFAGEANSGDVIVHHFGEFSHGMINGLAEATEELMLSNGDSKRTVKRVFSILIEGLQNIRTHGKRDLDCDQSSFVVIVKERNQYKIIFGNLIDQKDKVMIEDYFDKINRMSEEQLKQLYAEVLETSFFTRKGGAGIGFLTMRIKSEHPLEYVVNNFEENLYFFRFIITINRGL
jgi:hypothetical protein